MKTFVAALVTAGAAAAPAFAHVGHHDGRDGGRVPHVHGPVDPRGSGFDRPLWRPIGPADGGHGDRGHVPTHGAGDPGPGPHAADAGGPFYQTRDRVGFEGGEQRGEGLPGESRVRGPFTAPGAPAYGPGLTGRRPSGEVEYRDTLPTTPRPAPLYGRPESAPRPADQLVPVDGHAADGDLTEPTYRIPSRRPFEPAYEGRDASSAGRFPADVPAAVEDSFESEFEDGFGAGRPSR